MSRDEIFNNIKRIIVNISEIDSKEINEESFLMDDLSLSSMEVMTIMAEMEDAFSLKVPEQELRNFFTVSDLIEYVITRKSGDM